MCGGGTNRLSRRRFLVLTGAAAVAACTSRPQPDPRIDPGDPQAVPDEGAETLVAGAAVFDGTRLLEGPHDVLVRGETIADVGVRLDPPDATRVDADGLTLMPGLIDAHTHAMGASDLAKALLFGVTTELEMFSHPDSAAGLRQFGENDPRLYADLRSSGYLATAPGGHGTQFLRGMPTLESPDEADAWVTARRDEGSDYIKIAFDDFQMPTLTPETVEALVTSAHDQDLLAITHILETELARQAVQAGSDGLAHVWVDGDDVEQTAQACAEAGAFVVATLAAWSPYAGGRPADLVLDDPRLADRLTDADREWLGVVEPAPYDPLERGQAGVSALMEAGAEVLAGTDATNPAVMHGASLHAELELLVEAGLAPDAALAGATGRVADRFQLNDRGRIAAGRRADLLLVDGDPTQDITATRSIERLYRAGQQVDHDAVADYAASGTYPGLPG